MARNAQISSRQPKRKLATAKKSPRRSNVSTSSSGPSSTRRSR
ncbi:4139_t:CDS:1, partial [Dentiscutata heterogama]